MSFNGREAVSIENDRVRVTVLREGGHIAEILHKLRGVNPMWIPPWQSGEPSSYAPQMHPEYGRNAESKLLMGIMGHNVCLDIFGPPSEEEAAAGLTVHGEASVVRYEFEHGSDQLTMQANLPLAELSLKRAISLVGEEVHFEEQVVNLTAMDRPFAWTQHVTLGSPFINQHTQFTFPAKASRTADASFGGLDVLPATDFHWPHAPLPGNQSLNLSEFGVGPFSRFTTHLMEDRTQAGFAAFSPEHQLLVGYRWQRSDFPWLGLWQENQKRHTAPWNRRTITCGFEFGITPFPQTRREMIARPPLFETDVYRWLPAMGEAHASYRAFVHPATELSEDFGN
jgi:hypothetical protein